jgi:hypothetical protein
MATQDGRQRINDWDELYPGRFLKAGLLAENEKRILTITAVDLDELEGDKGKRVKGIISFREEKMQLALNKTNGICLREMFGRVPWKWEGKRIAIFASEWGGEPAIRIWGSPDIEADIEVEVQLPKRRPFRMTMHAMGDKLKPVAAAPRQELGDDARGQLAAMAAATTLEALMDIEADLAVRTFADHESAVLARALIKRRKQISDAQ